MPAADGDAGPAVAVQHDGPPAQATEGGGRGDAACTMHRLGEQAVTAVSIAADMRRLWPAEAVDASSPEVQDQLGQDRRVVMSLPAGGCDDCQAAFYGAIELLMIGSGGDDGCASDPQKHQRDDQAVLRAVWASNADRLLAGLQTGGGDAPSAAVASHPATSAAGEATDAPRPAAGKAAASRRSLLAALSEVLNYPGVLRDERLDAAFCTALLAAHATKPLRLKAGLLPGLVVLASHEVADVRRWAVATILGIPDTKRSAAEDLRRMFSTLRDVLTAALGDYAGTCTSSTANLQGSYNLSQDLPVAWATLSTVLSCLTDDGVDSLVEGFPHVPANLVQHLTSSLTNGGFWDVLHCLARMQESPKWSWAEVPADSISKVMGCILDSPAFNQHASTQPSVDLTGDLSEGFAAAYGVRSEICVSWIFPFLYSNRSKITELPTLITGVLDRSAQWTRGVQSDLAPVLSSFVSSREQLGLSEATCDSLMTAMLQYSGHSNDLRTNQTLSEFVSSDIDSLESAYQSIYRDGGVAAVTTTDWKFHHGVWEQLSKCDVVDTLAVVRHVFTEFSRIHLLDRVRDGEGGPEAAPVVQEFNRALSAVWLALEHVLKECPRTQETARWLVDEIGANALFCIVSPNANVSSACLLALQAALGVTG
ncbi:hypothetical protein HK405_005379 [Cladochytrium tenue]|nr:hypothetical protein HK405_005379 [Cladochytrium tenue]